MNQLYDVIFHRKSVRKYDMEPLSEEVFAEVTAYAKSIKPLDANLKYDFSYLGAKDVKNLLPIKAPHYICIYSEKQDPYLMNAGFVLQELDLYLSAQGMGTCWLGMAKPAKEVPQNQNGLSFVIMLAFGKALEPVHRERVEDFKRKTLDQITDLKNAEELLEPVRLSPSATNSQPWYFSGSLDEVVVSRVKLGMVKAVVYNTMNRIDMGIALKHLMLSAEHVGRTALIDFDEVPCPKGYEFMARVKLEPR